MIDYCFITWDEGFGGCGWFFSGDWFLEMIFEFLLATTED